MQFQFQSIILYIIHDWNIPPFDLSSLLTSENNSVPYFYFVLFGSTILSVGVSYVRLLTEDRRQKSSHSRNIFLQIHENSSDVYNKVYDSYV